MLKLHWYDGWIYTIRQLGFITALLSSLAGSLALADPISLAPQAACTIVGNATGSNAAPTAVTLGTGLACSGGQIIATGGGGGSVDITDGTNTVTGISSLTVDPKSLVVGGSAGAATLTPTVTIGTDRSSGNYTIDTTNSNTVIPVGATHTYTLARAGAAGFGAGWGTCVQNVSASGNATISTTTSVFNGAGGGTSFLLEAGGWACSTSKGGNWYTQVGHYNQPLSNTGVTAGSYTCMNGTVMRTAG